MSLMNMGMITSGAGAPLLASGAAAATLVVLTIFGSNRIQRQINSTLARLLARVRPVQVHEMPCILARLERVSSLEEFFEEVPWITARAARVTPVTVFRLDGDRFVPVSGTSLDVKPEPVWADEPLARGLQNTESVRYLIGRADDLENAPIHAVNGGQVESCDAICAIPLKRDGLLVGFLLCGPGVESPGPDLTLMSVFETLAERFADVLRTLPASSSGAASDEVVTAEDHPSIQFVMPEPLGWRMQLPIERTVFASQEDDVEPQVVGHPGGFETRD